FFFSSRRRHTRSYGDWSSDVCSSDLGGAAASDAFYPFEDGVEAAAAAGVAAVIQPGGAMRDEQVIERADELGLAMVFTGERHFRSEERRVGKEWECRWLTVV